MSNHHVTLDLLKTTRMTRGVTPRNITDLTGIDPARFLELETKTKSKRKQPYLDEAVTIARVLGTDGILPLITSGDLTQIEAGIDTGHDLPALHAGVRLPLNVAVRLTCKLGLADPAQLLPSALHQQLWSVLASNERGAAPGECPWCLASIAEGEPHRPTCLPHNLFQRDAQFDYDAGALIKEPDRSVNSSSGTGHGLRALRESRHLTQAEMAGKLGLNPNHYARMERLEIPVTTTNADKLATLFEIDPASIYAKEPVT